MGRINPWAEEYLSVIDTLWENEQYVEGRAVLEQVLFEEPDYAKAHQYAGWYALYRELKRAKAIMHYELAIKFDPDYGVSYAQYAEILVQNRDLDRMKRLVETGLVQPSVDKAGLLNDYGRVLEMRGEYRIASAQYKAAMAHTMNTWTMTMIRNNRRRVRAKYHLFSAIYSVFV